MQQLQLNQCSMTSPQHNGTATSQMIQGMSPVQGMQYQPLQHFTPQQPCFDEFYTGNISPSHIMSSQAMPTIQGSPNHLIQGSPTHLIQGSPNHLIQGSPTHFMNGNCSPNTTINMSTPNHLNNGSATSKLVQTSPSLMYAPASTTYVPASTTCTPSAYSYDNSFYKPY